MEQRALDPYVTVLFGHEQGKYPDGNSVLVRGTQGSVVIDPSLSVHAMAAQATGALTVDMVLLTHMHEDHAAGLSAVRAPRVAVHVDDLPALHSVEGLMRLYGLPPSDWGQMTELVTERFHIADCPHGEGFTDGAEWDLGGVVVRAVHAPGHTAGHSVFVIESDSGTRTVVTGDIDLSTFGPYYGDAASSLDAFESTLATVRGIEADHYVTFHHKGVVEGHAAFVAAVDQYGMVFGRRHEALLALLGPGPQTLDALVEQGIVYRAGTRPPVFGTSVERRTIEQHLARAVERGEVAVVPSDATDGSVQRYRVAR
jgi:glyoxylase-like metal-dependent hydrolase (beta-lactamase superfamily II)